MTAWLEDDYDLANHHLVGGSLDKPTCSTCGEQWPCSTYQGKHPCEHFPNDRGTACASCGIPAEMVPPDELAAAMMAAHDALILERAGQLTAFGDGR